jgi:predicted transcriptional regulator
MAKRKKTSQKEIDAIKKRITDKVSLTNNAGLLKKIDNSIRLIEEHKFNAQVVVANSIETQKMLNNIISFDRAFKSIRKNMGQSIDFDKAKEFFEDFNNIQKNIDELINKLAENNIGGLKPIKKETNSTTEETKTEEK